MATDILRGRATERFSHRPRRSVPISILITLALAVAVVALPEQGASAPVFTKNGWSTRVTASATSVRRGDRVRFRVKVSASVARSGRVRLAIVNPDGRRVLRKDWRPRSFAADTPRFFTTTWQVRANQRLGTYRVRVAVFRADLAKRYHLNRSAATVTVVGRREPTRPPPPPTSTTAPTAPTTTVPPSPRRFGLLAPGATLPPSAQCASWVRPAPEVRPVNQRPNRFGDIPNQTRGVAGAWRDADPSKAPFTARVDGAFVGTTDEIIQSAACKWGVDEDYVRGQIVTESSWDQVNSLGDWGTGASGCDPRFPLGTDGHPGQCPQSLGLGQTRYPYMSSAFPHAYDSSAYNLDVTYAIWRACFEGTETWLNTVERGREYAAGDMVGCMGRWFAGRWYTQPALDYMAVVQGHVDRRTWTTPDFLAYDPGG